MKIFLNILRWIAIIPAVALVFVIANIIDYLMYQLFGLLSSVPNVITASQLIMLLMLGAYEGGASCGMAHWLAPNHKIIATIIGGSLAVLINIYLCIFTTNANGLCANTIIQYVALGTCVYTCFYFVREYREDSEN